MRRVITVAAIAGLLILPSEARQPLVAAAVLVSVFAIFHGHAHGRELPPGQSGLAYSMGFVVATGSTWCGILMGLLHAWRTGRLALRVSGSAIALAGLVFLWRALA